MPFSTEFMDNPHADRVHRIAGLAQSKTRQRTGLFLVEGPQSVRELVTCRPELIKDLYVQAYAQEDSQLQPSTKVITQILGHANIDDIYVHYVSLAVMRQMSEDSQGIVAVAQSAPMRAQTLSGTGRIAAFWEIRDPGNAGTVIRAADAAGCSGVIFVDDCVDYLNPKVIRSTAGSLFHIPVVRMTSTELFTTMKDSHVPVIAADVHGVEGRQSQSLPELVNNPDCQQESQTVLFGNEARGLPDSILRKSQRIVFIPMYGKAESLNLATSAAIMLHTMAMSSHVGRI